MRKSALRTIWLPAACLAALWAVALMAGGPASDWDLAVFSAMRRERWDWFAELAWAVTWFGDWLVLVPVALAAAGFLLWRKSAREAAALLATVAAVRALVALQKLWFARARPDVEQWMVEYSNSFPSAHAANSAVTFLAVAILLVRSRSAVVAAIAASAAIGVSRVVLGVHWPSDVIGGWAFGILAALPLWAWRPLHPVRPHGDW